MADLTRTIEIIFGAQDRGVRQAVNDLNSALDSLGSSGANLSQLTSQLANVADAVLLTEAAVAGLATAYAVTAVNAAGEFQTAQIGLSKQLTDPAGLAAATQLAEDLALKYGTSANTVLQATTDFVAAGYDVKDAGALAKDALDLMTAGDISLNQATDVLLKSMLGFKLEVKDIPGLLNGLNLITDQFATDMPNLTEAMGRAAPAANALGFSWKDLASYATPMLGVFKEGEIVGTALSSSLSKLVDDSKPVVDTLKLLGVAQYDANGNLRTGKQIMDDLIPSMSKLDSTQQLYYSNQLFGIEQGPKMVTIFQNMDQVNKAYNLTLSETDSIQTEVNKKLASYETSLNRAKEALTQLNVAVGNELLQKATGLTDGFTALAGAFEKVVESGKLDVVFDAINAALGELGTALQDAAANLPAAFDQVDFSGLVRSIENLKDSVGAAFEALFGEVDLKTPEGVAQAIQKIVDAITVLTNTSAGIVDSWQPLLKWLGDLGETAVTAGKQADDGLFGKLLGYAQQWNTVIGPSLETLATAFGVLTGALSTSLFLSSAAKVLELTAEFVSFEAVAARIGIAVTALGGPYGALAAVIAGLAVAVIEFNSSKTIEFYQQWAKSAEQSEAAHKALNQSLATVGLNLKDFNGNTLDARNALDELRDKFGDSNLAAQTFASTVGKTDDDLNSVVPTVSDVKLAFFGLADAIDAMINAGASNAEIVEKIKTVTGDASVTTDNWREKVRTLGEQIGISNVTLDNIDRSFNKSTLSANEFANGLQAAADYAVNGARSMEEVNQILDSIYGTTEKTTNGFETYNEALAALTNGHKQGMIVMQDGRYVIDDFYNSTEAVTAATEKSTEATKTGSEEWKRVQDVLTNNTKVANEYQLKLEELATKKYEIDVQARVDMNIADLEAQTARFQASLDSTVAMAQSSATIIDSALSTLSSINEWFEPQKFALVQQVIQAELDNRRREIDLQEQLINKQMEYLTAKAQRLNSGDALIKIEGGQLQTELQLVFDKILKFTQVRATEDGLNLLLGV